MSLGDFDCMFIKARDSETQEGLRVEITRESQDRAAVSSPEVRGKRVPWRQDQGVSLDPVATAQEGSGHVLE